MTNFLTKAAEDWLRQGPPKVWPGPQLQEPGLSAIFFDSVLWRGQKTRVFAWLGLPPKASSSKPVPAIILVHGGGGTAFARWARWWRAQGFAVLAIDTCGAVPFPDTGVLNNAAWPRHRYAGPPGCGGFNQAGWPLTDQWVYHAAAAMVKARLILASLPAVDAKRIGLTGISWGGFLACLAAGIDPGLAAVAPVYGCGFITKESFWTKTSAFAAHPAALEVWRNHWDPANVLARVKIPLFWLNGTNDFAFWPPSWQKSAKLTKGPRQLCLKVRWPHGHIPQSEEAPETLQFFRHHLQGQAPLCQISPPQIESGRIVAFYAPGTTVRNAHLVVTRDRGYWPDREWHAFPATIERNQHKVAAAMPPGTTAAYLALLSADWLTSTSDVVFLDG